MKVLPLDEAVSLRNLLRMNIALGLIVILVAYGYNVTGEYASLAEIQAADAKFNTIAVGGLLYSVATFLFCQVSKPFWFPRKNR